MKHALALLTAALFLLTTPAVSLARGGRGHDHGDRQWQQRNLVQQRFQQDRRGLHGPPKNWKRHHGDHGCGPVRSRPRRHHRHQHLERLFIGVPGVVLQFRW